MNIIIGHTGVVGKSLCEQINFDYYFNRTNLNEIKKLNSENSTLYLSCLPASKWLINQNIKSDINNIWNIINTLQENSFGKIVLISTIDVYSLNQDESNEDTKIVINNLSYGSNRLFFELLVKNTLKYEDLKIFRLPALFNKNIKKNVLFDLIYANNIDQINVNSQYQWYNLDNLVKDIKLYSTNFPTETIFNLFTEPIDTQDIIKLFPTYGDYRWLFNKQVKYNFKTKHSKTGYIQTKENTLLEIQKFINEVSCK